MDAARSEVWSTPHSAIPLPAADVPTASTDDRTPPVRAFLAGFAVSLLLAPWLAESLFARLDPSVRPEPLLPVLPLPLIALVCAVALVGLGFACVDGRSRPLVRIRDGALAGLIGSSRFVMAASAASAASALADVFERCATFVPPVDITAELAWSIGHIGQGTLAPLLAASLVGPSLGAIGGLASTTPRALTRVSRWTLWIGVGPAATMALVGAAAVCVGFPEIAQTLSHLDQPPDVARPALFVLGVLFVWQVGVLLAVGVILATFAFAIFRSSSLAGVRSRPLPELERHSVAAAVALFGASSPWTLGLLMVFGMAVTAGPLATLTALQDQTPTTLSLPPEGASFWASARFMTLAPLLAFDPTVVLALLGARWMTRRAAAAPDPG